MILKFCAWCKGEFKAQREGILCCSYACSGQRKTKLRKINCPHCRTLFKPERTTTQFCSTKCARTFRRGKPNSKKTPGYWLENGYKIIQVNGAPIKQHRYIMQKHLKRPLLPSECVHHKNHDKADNRIENLDIIPRGEHSRLHRISEIKKGKRLFQKKMIEAEFPIQIIEA